MGCSHSRHSVSVGKGGLVVGKNSLSLLSRGSCSYCDHCEETLAEDIPEDVTSESSSEHEARAITCENDVGDSGAATRNTTVALSKSLEPADAMCCHPSAEDSPRQSMCCRKGMNEVRGDSKGFFASLSTVMSQDFDMDVLHPQSPPFLGSSYSIASEEVPQPETSALEERIKEEGKERTPLQHDDNGPSSVDSKSPAVPQPSPLETFVQGETSSGTRLVGQSENQSQVLHMPLLLANPHPITPKRKLSLDSGTGISCSTLRTVTTTCTSATHETNTDYGLGFNAAFVNGGDVAVTFTPRRLFTDESSRTPVVPDSTGSAHYVDCAMNNCRYGMAVSRVANEAALAAAERMQHCTTTAAAVMASTPPRRKKDEDLIIRNGVLIRGTISTPSSTSRSLCQSSRFVSLLSLSDFDDGNEKGVRAKKLWAKASSPSRHCINTLPSTQHGKPIRLRVTETYGESNHSSLLDQCDASTGEHDSYSAWTSEPEEVYEPNQFSYDPYFSIGQYRITTPSGTPWGNGLSVKMGVQYMTLQDRDGRVLAATRSRHTWVPSHVIYSPKPRFEGQIPSSHRPITDGTNLGSQQGIVDLYPWALVRKEGRDMEHDVTIHFAEEIRSNTILTMNKGVGSFSPNPAFRSRHGFARDGFQTHTVVSRIDSAYSNRGNSGCKKSLETKEIPCCIIIRDSIDRDVFHLTIAPGIDPLLLVCYLAVHAKMDVEPMMSGQ